MNFSDFVCYDEAKEDAALLRVTSERRRESLEMFFEQCIKDPILRKHGKNTWILQMSNKSGNPIIKNKQGDTSMGLSCTLH